LLPAAADLFAERGYRATTLDDVAARLGMKKGSLYHYIRSKEELLAGIYEQIFDRIEAAVRPIAEGPLPAEQRLRAMIQTHLAVVTEELDMLAVAFQEEAELPADIRHEIRSRKRAYERIFETVIRDGQRHGTLRLMDARLTARGLLGMCNWLYQWFRPDRHSLDEVTETFVALLEHGWISDGIPLRAVQSQRCVDDTQSVAESLTGLEEQVAHLNREIVQLRAALSEPT
jgi:AcrR family transcriptional regulator